jgi:transposase
MREGANEAKPITSSVDPDLSAVRRFIQERIVEGAIAVLIASILDLLRRMRDLNAELVRKLAATRRKKPANEEFRRLQLEMPFMFQPPSNDDAAGAELPAGKNRTPRGPRTRTPHGRPKLPADLPRVVEAHAVDAEHRNCTECGTEATRIGAKVAEKLDIIPAQFVVRRVEREVVACPRCHGYVFTAPRLDEVLDRGVLGNELLVQSLIDHYQDAVPWERMERNARQLGVPLSAVTLAGSVGRVIDLFEPIVRHILDECLRSGYVALDATRIPVLDGEHPLGIRSGSLWLLDGDHRYAYFLYAPTGHAAHLEKLLDGYKLELAMCDASPTNNVVQRAGATRAGCHSHGRRGLVEALRAGDARAVEGLEIYAAIFHVDAEARRAGDEIAQRFARRHRESVPLVDKLRAWIDARMADVEPKSTLGRAVRYLHRQWTRLTEFLRDERVELTNNEVEGELRTWVLDRKTWLFVGHDVSARRTADTLTIITTCKKHGIDPRRYVRDTLGRILAGEKDLAALLPENYAPAIPSVAA